MKERVAIINSVMDFGSTGSLARHLYEYGKKNQLDTYVFYGRGKKYDDKNIIKIDSVLSVYLHKFLSLITGLQGYFSIYPTVKLINSLRRKKITSLILLNLHGYYLNEKMLFNYIRQKNINVIYITPDEYAAMGKCCYSKNCTKYITKCENCPNIKEYPKSLFFDQSSKIFKRKYEMYSGINHITFAGPQYNLDIFRRSYLLKNKRMIEVNWGIDTENTYFYQKDENIYNKYNIPKDKVIVLTVGQYSHNRKGVKKIFFEMAKKITVDNYHFVNVGYDGSDNIPKNITAIPYIDNQSELRKIYSIADIYVLSSDADTMPLSCLIAFACGTPVCCFYTSGLKYLAPEGSSLISFAKEITVDSMLNVILSKNKKTELNIEECTRYANKKYSINVFNNTVYRELMRGKE